MLFMLENMLILSSILNILVLNSDFENAEMS